MQTLQSRKGNARGNSLQGALHDGPLCIPAELSAGSFDGQGQPA